LARQQNIDIIVKSIYYGNQDSLYDKISPKGFDGAPDTTPDAVNFFVVILEDVMMEDVRLNQILVEKKHIRDSAETGNKILEMLQKALVKNNGDGVTSNSKPKEKWTMVDSATGKPLPFKEGERYTQVFPNGMTITFMIKDDTVFTELTPADGLTAYYELDFSGNVKNTKFPYELSEYSMVIPPTDIVQKKIIYLANGFSREEYILKWNRQATVLFNAQGKIHGVELSGGWSISHRDKSITPGK
jgi:hypothetical protein